MSVALNDSSDEGVCELEASLAVISEISKDVISTYKENSF